MAMFGILTDNSKEAVDFIAATKEKLKDSNYIKNPFTGDIARFFFSEQRKGVATHLCIYIIKVTPVYFNYSIFAWLSTFLIYLFWGWTWLLIPALVVCSGSIFWSKYFFYWVTKKGLRKGGYKGEIRLLTNKSILEYLYFPLK